jgi:NhaA family Na+:H+ antiporter
MSHPGQPAPNPSWLASERAIPRLVARPLREFLRTEIAGGVVLLIATLIALIWANSPFDDSYASFWETKISFQIAGFELEEDFRHVVNDGLMAIFFFVVGLEIKRELVRGELADRRRAALPVAAAVGGMVVPALIYVAFNAGGEASRGWGIPMATDIAFALGVLSLVAPQVPSALKVFLLSLAIADDIGAIVVIAIFYSEGISLAWLVTAFALVGLVVFLTRIRVWWTPVYVIVGVGLWLATFESGVHATLAGVALGLLTPVTPLETSLRRRIPIFEMHDEGEEDVEVAPQEAQLTRRQIHISTSVAERLEYLLHPWTGYVIVPIFALANAGVRISGSVLADAVGSGVTLGVFLGLVVGKIAGIAGASWLSQRMGWALPPRGVTTRDMLGVAALAGIGFTVSIFITELALDDPHNSEAKIGVLVASLAASLIGAALLRRKRGGNEVESE